MTRAGLSTRRAAPSTLLLAALLAAGGGARAASAVAAPPALTPTAQAKAAPAAVPVPAAAPASSASAAPPAGTPALPAALHGRWEPVSQALAGAGPLTLAAQSLSWAPCGAAARAVRPDSRASDTTTEAGVLLSLPGQPGCRLDGYAVTHLRAQPRAGRTCELALSVYESEAQLARRERLAWGVYTRTGCQEPPAH